LLPAVLLFGSIYLAVGSACNDFKDIQGLMMPVLLVLVLPMMTFSVILQTPSSGLSVGLSLFPTATPFLMLLRVGLQPDTPFWQVGLSMVLSLATSLFFVFAASKIFRVGLLMQGKAPSFAQMVRWIWTK